MRVTSTPARTNSCAAAAASLTLSEPVRIEPGMTRIFTADMISIALQPPSTTGAGPSAFAIHPDARRRNVHPDPFGRFGGNPRQRLRDRRRHRIGELNERRAGRSWDK